VNFPRWILEVKLAGKRHHRLLPGEGGKCPLHQADEIKAYEALLDLLKRQKGD
jgi:hypothetical protein